MCQGHSYNQCLSTLLTTFILKFLQALNLLLVLEELIKDMKNLQIVFVGQLGKTIGGLDF